MLWCNHTLLHTQHHLEDQYLKTNNAGILSITSELTCWSQSGHDLVAIFTFFVLFADIVGLRVKKA